VVRVAIYTRVSTEDQAKEGFSLAAQEERLRAYCRARGWEVTGFFQDDGYSGRTTRRPAYEDMMAQRESWDTVLVLKMDRIHRNSRHFMEMMEELGEAGKDFVSATESLDTTTAMGRFVMDIIQRIAQLESEQIGERVYIGMSQKAKTGPGVLGFPAPLGYDVIEGNLRVNDREAPVVRDIFERARAGQTMDEISKELNGLGLQTKRGRPWTAGKVYRILHNPVYAGHLRWDHLERKAEHEPIVPVEMFNEVQRAVRARAPFATAHEPPLSLEA
jgi:site-specific DNA recombinase